MIANSNDLETSNIFELIREASKKFISNSSLVEILPEEVAQEAIIRLLKKLEKEKKAGKEYEIVKPEAFVNTLVRRIAINQLKAFKKWNEINQKFSKAEAIVESKDNIFESNKAEDTIDLLDSSGKVIDVLSVKSSEYKFLQLVPQDYRAAFALKYFAGLKLRNISEIVGIKEKTLSKYFGRFIDRLTPAKIAACFSNSEQIVLSRCFLHHFLQEHSDPHDYDRWDWWESNQSKVEDVLSFSANSDTAGLNYSALSGEFADYLFAQADFQQAEKYYLRCLEINERIFNENHLNVVECCYKLAGLYDRQAKFNKSELLYERAIKICKNLFNDDSLETAMSYHNYAVCCQRQMDFVRAESLLIKSIDLFKNSVGEDDPKITLSLCELAGIYLNREQYLKAEEIYLKSIEIYNKRYGKGHPDTAIIFSNLAMSYYLKGENNAAEKFNLQALKISEHVFGEGHYNLSSHFIDLAHVYLSENEYDKAFKFFNKGFEIRRNKLGISHPKIAECLVQLAMFYFQDGKIDEAKAHLKRAIEIYDQTFDYEHPDKAYCYSTLGTVYFFEGNCSKAEHFYKKFQGIYESTYATGLAKFLDSKNNLKTSNLSQNQQEVILSSSDLEDKFSQQSGRGQLKSVNEKLVSSKRVKYSNSQGDLNCSVQPIKNEYKKIGRNDPCPCGSKTKYKKCCGG